MAALALAASACGVKRTVRVPVSPKVAAAKTADFQQLLSSLEKYESISSLSSTSLRITLTSGKLESGTLERYRGAPGYLLLKRPDYIRISIQNPLTKTAILELLSGGESFSLWMPRDNKYFVGRNSQKELVYEDEGKTTEVKARPLHIFEALMTPAPAAHDGSLKIALEEDQDSEAKYYVLSFYDNSEGIRLRPVRKIWIERSELVMVRQHIFREDGTVESRVEYSGYSEVDGYHLPLSVRLDRPLDGYALDMEFRNWRLNPDLPETAFEMNPPTGAHLVTLKEPSGN